ncbi:MAG: hypothetical protein ACI35Q_04605 [Marinilabiliaceae bacterium]
MGQRIFPVGGQCQSKGLPSHKDTEKLLRATLPDVLIDNFDVDRFEKADTRFDVWLDPKKYGCALR